MKLRFREVVSLAQLKMELGQTQELYSRLVILNREWFLSHRWYLAMFGDILCCYNWGEGTIASSGMLLNITMQGTAAQQRIICPKMSLVPRLGNLALKVKKSLFSKFEKCHHWYRIEERKINYNVLVSGSKKLPYKRSVLVSCGWCNKQYIWWLKTTVM